MAHQVQGFGKAHPAIAFVMIKKPCISLVAHSANVGQRLVRRMASKLMWLKLIGARRLNPKWLKMLSRMVFMMLSVWYITKPAQESPIQLQKLARLSNNMRILCFWLIQLVVYSAQNYAPMIGALTSR